MSMTTVTPTRRAAGRTPTLLWIVLIIAALAALAVMPFAAWLFQQDLPPINITIDGTEYVRSVHLGALSTGHKLVVVGVVYAAIVALLIALPVVLLTVVFAVLVAVVLGIGVPLVLVAMMVVMMLSPLLLLAALIRWGWRTSTRRTPAMLSA